MRSSSAFGLPAFQAFRIVVTSGGGEDSSPMRIHSLKVSARIMPPNIVAVPYILPGEKAMSQFVAPFRVHRSQGAFGPAPLASPPRRQCLRHHMRVRHTVWMLAVLLVAVCPSAARAQSAWVPPKGEVALSTTYQWLNADRHLFSNLTGPELTPMEIAKGVDFQSNSLDLGNVQSHALVVDGDVGITDSLALSASLAFIAARYRGENSENPLFDDGTFHGSAQDVQLGARYAVARDLWTFTPFTTFTFPVRDYEVLAHAAQGFGLKMLEFGMDVGRILQVDGAAKGYLQGTYGYSFTERPFADMPVNRSRAVLEGGYFIGRFTLQGLTTWRRVHGGLEWSELGSVHHQEHFAGHDQAAATREWRYTAGVSVQLSDVASVEISYGDLLTGANTHAARVISAGWTWGFHAFGGTTLGVGFR